jgi:hypothetical protein
MNDNDIHCEEQIPLETDAYALALQNEQAMRNMATDETRQ